jgi:hypothetical protein
MTCIVAITNGTNIWMGGDAAGIGENGAYDIRSTPKVFRRYFGRSRTPWLFGFAGDFRIGQLIQHKLKLPNPAFGMKSIDRFAVQNVTDRLRVCLAEHKALTFVRGVSTMDAILIIGVAGHLFLIDYGFQIVCPKNPYAAIGIGEDIAFGSLYTTENITPKFDPKARIKLALAAAKQHNTGVQEPFTIISTRAKK